MALLGKHRGYPLAPSNRSIGLIAMTPSTIFDDGARLMWPSCEALHIAVERAMAQHGGVGGLQNFYKTTHAQ